MAVEQKIEAVTEEDGTQLAARLPQPFLDWFASRGWHPRAHQLDLLARAQRGDSTLLVAPTGAGKTLAGFLPALTDLVERPKLKPGAPKDKATRGPGVHTLYISPLKALAVDIKRNLEMPIAEMGLDITVETRTGDTPAHRRQRQKLKPPEILLTTPEQLSLLISHKDADRFFEELRYVVFDELHSLVTSKRGQLLSLGLARLRNLRPNLQTVGLSATVSNPHELCQWLAAQNRGDTRTDYEAGLVTVQGGAKPQIEILDTKERLPWSGHSARHAVEEVYERIKMAQTAILFVNTRSQAEFLFQNLWHVNEDNLPIALHHGSLDVGQRRKVEAAMADNRLRAVVATSTLDLGIDWGDVDLVVHIGAPKGASRLAQRIGRSNHRMDEPSQALLVPANRFEVMECQAALDANYLGHQDTPPLRAGALDVLCQHIFGMAVAKPFYEDDLYDEVISAAPYAELDWDTFERAVHFVATGGYALANYERYAKIKAITDEEGRKQWRLTHPRFAQQYRLNSGTIYEAPSLNVRMLRHAAREKGQLKATRGGRVLGKLEEYFLEQMVPGDTFMFATQILRYEGIRENEAIVTPAQSDTPMVPMYAGSKFPLTTYLAEHIRAMMADPQSWGNLPPQVSQWLRLQSVKSIMPTADQLLVETFPRGEKFYLVAYTFEGRLAHQSLGMLLTKRLERADARPTGFVATDYCICIWGLNDMGAMIADGSLPLEALFEEDMLGDDLETWMSDSFMLKRTFRHCALIAGLIEKNQPGKEKSGRQVTISTDLIYDVLRDHEPDHILMQATREDAATGLLDIHRLGDLLARIRGHIVHIDLEKVSPLAVPIMLEVGREPVAGSANDSLLAEAAQDLIDEAMTPV
ncbi:MAG: ligase-associated DNA damage response DEXH box helicase [Pseudomonadota bacterium]